MMPLNNLDVEFTHMRMTDGRGFFRVTHVPTGLYVEGYNENEPIKSTYGRLKDELERKLSKHLSYGTDSVSSIPPESQ